MKEKQASEATDDAQDNDAQDNNRRREVAKSLGLPDTVEWSWRAIYLEQGDDFIGFFLKQLDRLEQGDNNSSGLPDTTKFSRRLRRLRELLLQRLLTINLAPQPDKKSDIEFDGGFAELWDDGVIRMLTTLIKHTQRAVSEPKQ